MTQQDFNSTHFLNEVVSNNIDKHLFWNQLELFLKENRIEDIDLFVSCFPAFNNLFANDYGSGRFYNWLRDYIECQPEVGIEIKSKIEYLGSKEFYEFWPTILSGLSKSGRYFDNELIKILNTEIDYCIVAGIGSACLISFSEENRTIDLILAAVNPKRLKPLLLDISWAYFIQLMVDHLENKIAVEYIEEILDLDSQYLYSALARHLNEKIKPIEQSILFDLVLEKLSKTPLSYLGVYNTIHFQLRESYTDNPQIISNFFKYWIENQLPAASNMEVLNLMLFEIQKVNSQLISSLLIKWLISSSKYGLAAQYVITLLSRDKIAIKFTNPDVIKLTESETLELLLRIVGFVFDQNSAYAMFIQILECHVTSQEIIDCSASLLYGEILLNYPSFIEKLKEEETSDERLASVFTQIIQKAEEYFQRLEKLPKLLEFAPSSARTKYYNKVQMAGINLDGASAKSSWMDMVDHTNLRAGKGFFHKTSSGFSEASEMKTISISAEMPHLELLDPTGQQLKRIQYRYATIDELYNT